MAETIENLEEKIKTSLLKERKPELVTGGFKITIEGEGQIEIVKLHPLNLEQMELPLNQQEKSKKGGQP